MKTLQFTLGALLMVVLFVACEQDNKLNLTDTPFANQRMEFESTDTITVLATTVIADNTVGSNASQGLFGKIHDDVFGTTEAAFFAQFSPSATFNWPDQPTVDSVVLTLQLVQQDTLTRKYLGNPQNPLKIEVYKINSEVPDTSFNTNFDIETEMAMTKVGELNIVPDVEDNNLNDSIFKIYLDQSVAQDLFQSDTVTQLNANDLLKGLYFKSTHELTEAIYFIDLFQSATNLSVYAHNEVDTVQKILYCGAFDTRMNLYKHDYSAASPEIQNLQTNQPQTGEYLFLQGGGGFNIELSLPYIHNLVKDGNIAVAKAQLIFEEDTISTLVTDPVQYTYIFGLDDEQKSQYLEEYYADDTYYAVKYDEGYYSYNLAQYIQNLLENTTDSKKLTIIPAYGKIDPTRSVLKSPQNTTSLKLVLTFSKL